MFYDPRLGSGLERGGYCAGEAHGLALAKL